MRNQKFRLADMMPNAWFYKLRDMNKTRNQIPYHTMKKKQQLPNHPTTQIPPNPSFKYTPESVNSPKKKPKRKSIYRPSPKQVIPSVSDEYYFNFNRILEPEMVVEASCFQEFDSPHDRHYSYDHHSFHDSKEELKISKLAAEFDAIISEPKLPRILTKPTTTKQAAISDLIDSLSVDTENYFTIQPKKTKTKTNPAPTRKSVVSRSRRLKIKNKKMGDTCGTRKIMSTSCKDEKKACNCFYSESFAMVKASFDPEKDFRDSMKEMIVEKNIKASRELEELLACYLSLNSTQYHHLIIKAFEQIWFTMTIST